MCLGVWIALNFYSMVFILAMSMSESLELKTVEECTPKLEIALSGIDREFVHFLAQEGFISKQVCSEVLNPQSTLTKEEKAGKLVEGVKRRVSLDPQSFRTLLDRFKEDGALYKPIVRILEGAHSKRVKAQNSVCDDHTEQGESASISICQLS